MGNKFYAKCKRCETEEEFEYVSVLGLDISCLRCGEKLINEINVQVPILTNE